MNLTKESYTRWLAKNSENKLFIFTDNCDRTSGRGKVSDNSEYAKRFGKTGLHYPSVTSAILRGLDNAYPITTQKGYKKGDNPDNHNWTDDDFEEFKKVIDDDFEHIKQACKEKGYKKIVFPLSGILNSKISKLTMERTPKLYGYIIEKEIELKKFEP
jgi:hypothetical protein